MTTHGVIAEYGNYSAPSSITSGPDGNIWLVEWNFDIVKLRTDGVELGKFAQGSSPNFYYPEFITSGPNNKLWFTGYNVSLGPPCETPTTVRVAASMSTDGQVTNFGFVTLGVVDRFGQIVTGPDGNLWFGGVPANMTPSGVFTWYTAPFTRMVTITSGPNGTLWLGGGYPLADPQDQIAEISTSGHLLHSYQLSRGGSPEFITQGPDGALWFTDWTNNQVGRITTDGVTTNTFRAHSPASITTGTDGALWFVEANGDSGFYAIGRMTTTGTLKEFPAPPLYGSITVGPDGNIWFVEYPGFGKIGRLTPQGTLTEFSVPNANGQIVAGPDGNLWFTETEFPPTGPFSIDSITPNGTVTRYPISDEPDGWITPGSDGNIWFTARTPPGAFPADQTELMYKATPSGSLAIFPLGLGVDRFPYGITTGKDGALWFTLLNGTSSEIRRITTSGILTAVSANVKYPGVLGQITTGPDGKLWFTDLGNFSVGRISAIGGTALLPNAVENTPFTSMVASFVDGAPVAQQSDFAATVDWLDGTTSPGTVSGPTGGPFSVSASHAYGEGTHPFKVTLHDNVDNAEYASTPGTVSVADAPLSPGTTVFPPGSCVEGAGCQFTLGSFTDADPKAAPGLYTASIDWGDGHSSFGNINVCGSEFCVSAYHIFADEGSFSTKIAVVDIGGSNVNLTGVSINVADAPLTASSATPASPHGVQFTEVIATFKDANPYATPSDFTASIDWGDTTSSTGTVSANNHHGFDVTGTHTYSDSGPHTAKVTINDVGGSTTSASSVVADDFPIVATEENFHVRLGKPFTRILGSFTTDPSINLTDLSATIDWGDGTPPETGVVLSQGSGIFNVQGTHTYTKIFGKNVTVQMNHTAGATAIASDGVRLWPKADSK
jgi:virginiamycin B lyase